MTSIAQISILWVAGWPAILLVSLFINSDVRAEVTFDGEWAGFGSRADVTGPKTRMLGGLAVEWISGSLPNDWRVMQAKDPSRIISENDSTSPTGGAVARVEVFPGDNVGFTGERAEVSRMIGQHGSPLPVVPSSQHEFYGISIKVASDWQPPKPDLKNGFIWGLFLQLHSPDEYHSSPSIALAAEEDFHLQMLTGDIRGAGRTERNRVADIFKFADGSLKKGHWVEFMLDIVWAYDSKGSIKIFRRDEGQKTFNMAFERSDIPTLQFYTGGPEGTKTHYWKAGYYRGICNVISRLWLGPIVRGTTFQEVAATAFGSN